MNGDDMTLTRKARLELAEFQYEHYRDLLWDAESAANQAALDAWPKNLRLVLGPPEVITHLKKAFHEDFNPKS